MGLCWSCFSKRSGSVVDPSSKSKPSSTTPRTAIEKHADDYLGEDEDQDNDQHPAVIEMTAFRMKEEAVAIESMKKKKKSPKISRMESLQSTVIREHDSSHPHGRKAPRPVRPCSSTGRLSPVKLKTQRNINPNSIRIRNEVLVPGTTADKTKSASDMAMANFQKLKLQVEVAKKHKLRQQKVQELEEEVKEADKYNSLWDQYETIQQKTAKPVPPVEYDLQDHAFAAKVPKTNNNAKRKSRRFTSGSASVRSFISQHSRKSRTSVKTDSGFRSAAETNAKSNRSSRRKKTKGDMEDSSSRKRSESFDLKETRTWYFDFDDLSPAGKSTGKDGSTCSKSQSNLSLLSESSLAVQRRLYEEKRQQRNRRHGTPSLSASKCQSETTTSSSQVEDYGPSRMRRRPSQESMNFSFTDMEVVAAPIDNSFLSDLDNDSLSYLSHTSRDFPPKEESVVYDHNAVVQQRLDIEAQLRALQAPEDDDDDEELAVTPLVSAGIHDFLSLTNTGAKPDPAGERMALEAREAVPHRKVAAAAAVEKAHCPVKPTLDITLSLQRFATVVEKKSSTMGSLGKQPLSLFETVNHQIDPISSKRSIGKTNEDRLKGSSLPASEDPLPGVMEIHQLSQTLSTTTTSRKESDCELKNSNDVTLPLRLSIVGSEAKNKESIIVDCPGNSSSIGDVVSRCDENHVRDTDLPEDEAIAALALTPQTRHDETPTKANECPEPVLNLESSRARLTQRMPLLSPVSPPIALSLERALRHNLDESMASEEDSQLFRVPYNSQTPAFGLPIGGSQSDSLVVNQSIDDSMEEHSVEGDSARRAFGTQPRVLLSSLQSPNSVLDVRETLEIAGKVEAHVHDVLQRYRSEDLYHN